MNNEDPNKPKEPDLFRRRRTVRTSPRFSERTHSEQSLNNRAIRKQKKLNKKEQSKEFLTKAHQESLINKEYGKAALISIHALREIARYSATRMPIQCHFIAKKYEDIIAHFSFYEPVEIEQKFKDHCNHLYQLCINAAIDPSTVRDPGTHIIYETTINENNEEEIIEKQLKAPETITTFFIDLKHSQSPVDFIDNNRKEVRRPVPSETTGWHFFFHFMGLGHLYPKINLYDIRDNEYVTAKTLSQFFSHYSVSSNMLKQVLNIYNPDQYSGPDHWSMKTEHVMNEILKHDNEAALEAAFQITKFYEEAAYQSSLILHEIRHPYFHIPVEKAEDIHQKLLKEPDKHFIHRQRTPDHELSSLQQEYDSQFYR